MNPSRSLLAFAAKRRSFPRALSAALLIAVCGPARIHAQAPAPVQFTGVSRLTWETANRQGFGQQMPPAFLRWDLNSILNVYGIPLSINALATTEDSYSPQTISAFSIGLSRTDLQDQIRRKIDERLGNLTALQDRLSSLGPEVLADSLRAMGGALAGDITPDAAIAKLQELRNLKETDMQARMDELQSMGLASATQGIASLFPTLVLGSSYPTYTRLTLDGVPVNGAQVECTPGMFYVALAGGQIQSATTGLRSYMSVFEEGAYRRMLAAGRLGVGARDDSHIFLNMVYGADDGGSVSRDSVFSPLTPQKNVVVGVDGRLFLLDDRLDIGGEVDYSVLTADLDAPGPAGTNIPSWLGSFADANITSSADVAFSLDGKYAFRESGTLMSSSFRRVGAGYSSPGAPYLRKDNMRFEGKVEQMFLQRQMSVAAFYKRDEDNLQNSKPYGTTVNAFGAQVALNFRNAPYFRFSYAPLSQVSRIMSDSLNIDTDVLAASALTGYTFRTSSGITSSTSLSFLYNEGKTATAGGRYFSRTAMLFQTLGFAFPLSLTIGAGVLNTALGNIGSTIVTSDFSVTYTALSVWQTTAGISLCRDATHRTGFYLRSSFPAWKGGSVDIWGERGVFDDGLEEYNESVLRVMVSQSW